jgi:ribosomal protein L37E
MFTKVQAPVCKNCVEDEEADFEKIREIIEKDESLNVEQVAEEADVDIAVVRRMVDTGRVKQVTLGERVKCGQCGAPAISMSKKLCQACLDKLNAQVSRAQSQIKLGARPDVQVGQYMPARQVFEDKRK